MDSYDILVIMLSVALLVFLIINIILGIVFIKVLKRIQATAESLQQTAEEIQNFISRLKTLGNLSAIGSAVAGVAKAFKKGEKKK